MNKFLNTILFANDQAIIVTSEEDLQRSLHYLNNITPEYNCQISKMKTQIMAFSETHMIRTKIFIDNHCLQQVKNFKYLGYDTSPHYDRDIDNKISLFQRMCGTIQRSVGKLYERNTIKIL